MVTPILELGYVPLTLPARDVTRWTGGEWRRVERNEMEASVRESVRHHCPKAAGAICKTFDGMMIAPQRELFPRPAPCEQTQSYNDGEDTVGIDLRGTV